MNDSGHEGRESRRRDWMVVVVFAEIGALLYALATAFLPGRTGLTWSPADLLFDDPDQIIRVATAFVFMNLLLLVLGAVGWLFLRRSKGHP